MPAEAPVTSAVVPSRSNRIGRVWRGPARPARAAAPHAVPAPGWAGYSPEPPPTVTETSISANWPQENR
jgi:hypothetical protein